MSLDDVNLLLTEEMRQTIPAPKVHLLQNALDGSLQWVYISCSHFCCDQLASYITNSTWKGVI